MKKFYESPKSLTVVIQAHGILLEDSPIHSGDDGQDPLTREQKNNWNDDWDDMDD